MKYKEMKFRVNSVEHGEAIQKRLFELGVRWLDGKVIQLTKSPYLYVDKDGVLLHGVNYVPLQCSDYPEYTLDDLYSSPIIEDKIHKLREMAQDMLEAINQLNYNND